MAGNASKYEKPKNVYSYPSRFGSHQSMVDTSYDLKDDKLVVCKDEDGPYVTEKWKLDCGLTDLNRCACVETRMERLNSLLKNV